MAVIKMNFLSQCLGMQTDVTICLPSYSFKDRMDGREDVYVPGMKYQVLWLLHGGSGDDSDYLHFSNITRYADDNKLAVVMPCGYNSCFMDEENGVQYMKYIAEELPKMCRVIFPFSDKREDNFIGGLSMGAHGAQWTALHYPLQYSAALIMSGGGIFFEKYWHREPDPKNPMSPHPDDVPEKARKLAQEAVANGTIIPKYLMTWGENDHLSPSLSAAAEFLKETGVSLETDIVPGYKHEWDFWDLALRKAINEWLPIRHSVIYPE